MLPTDVEEAIKFRPPVRTQDTPVVPPVPPCVLVKNDDDEEPCFTYCAKCNDIKDVEVVGGTSTVGGVILEVVCKTCGLQFYEDDSP